MMEELQFPGWGELLGKVVKLVHLLKQPCRSIDSRQGQHLLKAHPMAPSEPSTTQQESRLVKGNICSVS